MNYPHQNPDPYLTQHWKLPVDCAVLSASSRVGGVRRLHGSKKLGVKSTVQYNVVTNRGSGRADRCKTFVAMPSRLLPHEVLEVHADVADAFVERQNILPIFDYVDERKNAYATRLWAALQKGEDAAARAASLGASRSVQLRAARVAWRVANPETWHDAFAHGATARQDNARVEAIDKKKKRAIAACRADIFECEHQAALALHATEAAVAANDAVKVFKAHKRAGKFAWQAAWAKDKLWKLGYEGEASRLRRHRKQDWPHRKEELLQAVANAHGCWVRAAKIWWTLHESRLHRAVLG